MSITEIKIRFPENIDAMQYFEQLRWGEKIRCSYCSSDKVTARQNDNRFHCCKCKRTFSVTAGTFLHGSRIPLKSWIYAFAAVSNTINKFSVRQLQRDIQVSYTTAWLMYQDIKRLMTDELRENEAAGNLFEMLCKKAILPIKE
jgi:transposase-like protein